MPTTTASFITPKANPAATTGDGSENLAPIAAYNLASRAGAGGLAGQAAAQNLAAAPSIEALTKRIQEINQGAYLSAPGRQQQLATIQNQLAGNISPETVYQAQLGAAQKYGAGGFSTDSPAWQTAVQRALGLNREALIGAGQQAMNSMYAGMPVVNASQSMVTPSLLQQQQQAAAQLAEQSRQFNVSTAQGQQQFLASLAQRAREAEMQAAQAGAALNEQKREYDLTHSTQSAQFLAQLQEQARQANQAAALESTKLQLANQQFGQSQAQQASQFQQSLAQSAAQFGTTASQNALGLYARTYGTIPGYNEYGQWTGQTGTFPTAAQSYASMFPMSTTYPSTIPQTSPQSQYLGAGTRSSPYTPNPNYVGSRNLAGTSINDWVNAGLLPKSWGSILYP